MTLHARNFNHLYYFFVVAKLGGVTTAAQQLNTSQSSLSTQLKTLESQIGHRLFKKEGRKLVLTKTGHQVFVYCRRMFDVAGELEAYLARSDHRGQASFSLGVSPDIERPFVTDVLSATMQAIGNQQRPLISQVSFQHEVLVAKLELGELDAVISSQPIYSSSVRTVHEVRLAVKAVASPLLGRSVGQIVADAKNGLVIASPDMRLRWETDDYLSRKKIRRAISFESNVMGAIVRAAIDGLGVAFLPEPYILHEVKRKNLIMTQKSLWTHRLFLCTRTQVGNESGQLILTTLRDKLESAVRLV